ncbi:orotate phosphoribosyltransferase [Deinococcus metalli]|uniref:Orotate phosphoribosyltransferase n=1 Tax=Deinococcus metalli TaxID=1141878 RepID=A0A7W8KKS5_9DEIO|nr:orotate phosphoribosyltransferase [Deinococcus metalli]MBB5378811.1 orotate phosphoribosyltransferase [Deinococcus metalli]
MSHHLQELLHHHGALRPGHTVFRSGGHSDGWIEKGSVMRHPRVLEEVARWQAAQVREAFPAVTLLVGAPACGAVLATLVARELDVPVAYVLTDGDLRWHRMHEPEAGYGVVYIDDLICTGEGSRLVVDFLRTQGQEVLGVSAWVSRAALPVPLVTLLPASFETYVAAICPLCREGEAVQHVDVRE